MPGKKKTGEYTKNTFLLSIKEVELIEFEKVRRKLRRLPGADLSSVVRDCINAHLGKGKRS